MHLLRKSKGQRCLSGKGTYADTPRDQDNHVKLIIAVLNCSLSPKLLTFVYADTKRISVSSPRGIASKPQPIFFFLTFSFFFFKNFFFF